MSSNQVELKCIFNLFDSNNTGEVDIRVINQLMNSLDGLNIKKTISGGSIKPINESDKSPPITSNYLKQSTKDGKLLIKSIGSEGSIADLDKSGIL